MRLQRPRKISIASPNPPPPAIPTDRPTPSYYAALGCRRPSYSKVDQMSDSRRPFVGLPLRGNPSASTVFTVIYSSSSDSADVVPVVRQHVCQPVSVFCSVSALLASRCIYMHASLLFSLHPRSPLPLPLPRARVSRLVSSHRKSCRRVHVWQRHRRRTINAETVLLPSLSSTLPYLRDRTRHV